MEACLTHIDTNYVCIQLINESSKTFHKLMDKATNKYLTDKSIKCKTEFINENLNRMYFLVDEESEKLLRARVQKFSKSGEAYLVDIGSKINILNKTVIFAETLGTILSTYPDQVRETFFFNEDYNESYKVKS